MEFLHPLALWGLLAISVPIIIHLITRRRALRKPFAAIRFVLLSYQKMRRRLRLKRILILLARALAVAMLALMITRPTVLSRGGDVNMGAGSRTMVIVVDNTMSMSQKNGGGAPFDRAIEISESIIESLGPGQEAAVLAVDTGMMEKPEGAMLRADPKPLLKSLHSIRISYAFKPIVPALDAAAQLAKTGRYDTKQVLLITDLQQSGWEGAERISYQGVEVLVLDVGPQSQLSNAAVSDIKLKPAAGEARYEAQVSVSSYSKQPAPGKEIVIRIGDEERARGFADLPAGGVVEKDLTFSSSGKGALLGEVSIPADSLDADNVRYFTARAGGRISAIVVDGDPKPERYGAESYYLMNALNPRLETRSRIEPTLMTVAELETASLKGFDLVILTNVGAMGGRAVQNLKEFVQGGGALLFSLGDQVDPGEFQSVFGELAPAPLYTLKEPAEPEGIHLDPFRDEHPSTAIFRTPGGGDLNLPSFRKYYLIDSAGAPMDLKTALSYSDGAPALVERSFGMGRIAMFTSTLDRDWNDLCIYPTYLPLLQQFAMYLTGGLSDPDASGLVAGAKAKAQCPASSASVMYITPDGKRERTALASSREAKTTEISTDGGPGFYTVFCLPEGLSEPARDAVPDSVLAVNVDTRESNLERWNMDELKKKFGGPEGGLSVGRNIGELSSAGGFAEARKEIWKTLFVFMVGLLFMEGILTFKG